MSGFLRVLTFLVALAAVGPSFGAELYWPERGADRICRSLPDGSSWSVFVRGVVFDFRDAVFSDDFELGDTTAWSGTTP